jgi:hypothetical protein
MMKRRDRKGRQGQGRGRSLKEHRRLLYVALTRARDRLYVCGFESKKGVKEGSWYQLAQAAAESLGVKVSAGDGEITSYGSWMRNAAICRAGSRQPALPGLDCTAPRRRNRFAAADPALGCGLRRPPSHRWTRARPVSAADWWCMPCWRGCRNRARQTPRHRAEICSGQRA